MSKLKSPLGIIAIIMSFVFATAPLHEAFAQKNQEKSRMSVRQSRQNKSKSSPGKQPSVSHKPSKPPSSSRPPAYKPPPPHRPPKPPSYYHKRPPRYKGRHYRDYRTWRLIAGATAVIAIGTMLSAPPPEARIVVVNSRNYYVYDGVYYEQAFYGGEVVYQVIPAP